VWSERRGDSGVGAEEGERRRKTRKSEREQTDQKASLESRGGDERGVTLGVGGGRRQAVVVAAAAAVGGGRGPPATPPPQFHSRCCRWRTGAAAAAARGAAWARGWGRTTGSPRRACVAKQQLQGAVGTRSRNRSSEGRTGARASTTDGAAVALHSANTLRRALRRR
jgi:hypothetical protein